MTIHYHGLPITSKDNAALLRLAGKHFCVSYFTPQQVKIAHEIGQSVMIDNGAYSLWRSGAAADKNYWDGYYDFCERWLDYQTTWCIIPDVIDGDLSENVKIISRCPLPSNRCAPVWHMHEPISHLDWLIQCDWQKICIGSSGRYANVGDDKWRRRMDHVFNHITKTTNGVPPTWFHMLRGMDLGDDVYPFSSLDSTNVAQNHKRNGDIVIMANKIDARQCPGVWWKRAEQSEMEI